jgi:hypothetical protein
MSQSIQSARLSLQSSELAPNPASSTENECDPPPPPVRGGGGGGGQTPVGGGGGGGEGGEPIQDEGTDTLVL